MINGLKDYSFSKKSIPNGYEDYKKTIGMFVTELDSEPYMSFVVSYFKNKEVDSELRYLYRGDLLENKDISVGAYGKDKDEEILQYCFDYRDKDTQTLTKTFKNYILDKNLVEFCMDKVGKGSMPKGANMRISQCTIPTFVLYNPNKYKFHIEYGKFESQSKYEALGKILTDYTKTTLLPLQTKCKSSIFVSPRVFVNEKDDMLKDIKTDTQFIEEELKTLEDNGELYAVLPEDWLTKDEEAKRRLIANNYLDTVLYLPPYKMHDGRDLIWLYFNKHRDINDTIKIYTRPNMNYSNDTDVYIDSSNLQKKMQDCSSTKKDESIEQFLKRFDDDNKRNTIDRLYGEYINIIERRFTKAIAKEMISIIKDDILMPLHFAPNKETEFKEDSDIVKKEKELGDKIGRTILVGFLDSFVEGKEHKLIDDVIYTKLSTNDKIRYITRDEFKFDNHNKTEIYTLKPFIYNIPKFVVNILHSMRDLGNFGAHKEKSFENACTIRREHCGNLNNSIISCVFNFLDILQWYDKFLKEIDEGIAEKVEEKLYEVYEDEEGWLYCDINDKKATFQKGSSVEKGSKVRLLKNPVKNERDRKEEYPYIIFNDQFERI